MKTVAILPMRHSSERVRGKNYRILAGKPLFHWVVETLLAVEEIDEVVIDTDSQTIIDDAMKTFPEVRLLLRPEHLRAGEIPMNEVLANSIAQVQADLVLQTHSTNPFLSSTTISDALQRFLAKEANCDSAFGVTRLQARLWTAEAKAVNHDPKVLLRTQDLAPIYLENSCFYIFSPETLRQQRSRIGMRPLLIEVPAMEAIDIDEESDWQLASAIATLGVNAK